MKNVIILTKRFDGTVSQFAFNLNKQIKDCSVTIIIEETHTTLFDKLVNQYKNVKKHGLIWFPYRLFVLIRKIFSSSQHPVSSEPSEDILIENGVEILEVADYHDDIFLESLRAKKPTLGIVFGTGILKPKLFEIPEQGMINIHQGKIPDYRGQPPAFWELYNSESEVGLSVHCVAEKLDAGDLIFQTSLPISESDTIESLQTKLDKIVINEVPTVANDFIMGLVKPVKIDTKIGKVYSKPTLRQMYKLTKLRKKLMKNTVKIRK